MIHELKTWPEYYKAIIGGEKSFEVRLNDRNFQVGDLLLLKEYDPNRLSYTGREHKVGVTYILKGPAFGIEDGYVVMSFVSHYRLSHFMKKDDESIKWVLTGIA